uniref:Uncharacterized protein n=1 Tax=Candidatus Kentrum sp. LPFa TaxID=2126335 RepID=A0A450WZM3_9GAMM|nr:MAG: hypothetical protein BECKLPF1236B_GA0070989_13103 [Candidatus Kentron sp. LPFa]
MYRIRAIRLNQCPKEAKETGRVHFSGIHPLLREDQAGLLQGQTPHRPKEIRRGPQGLRRMGKQGATQTHQGRNATPRASAGKRPPELLRHHGQRNPVQQFTYRKKKNSEKPGLVIRAYPPSILARSASVSRRHRRLSHKRCGQSATRCERLA